MLSGLNGFDRLFSIVHYSLFRRKFGRNCFFKAAVRRVIYLSIVFSIFLPETLASKMYFEISLL